MGIVFAGAALVGCPRGQGTLARPSTEGLPAVLWRMQLEGDPWPHGLVGDTLFVWNMRVAHDGFRFPIQLAAHAPGDGKALWTSPVRPWLMDTAVPWSVAMASAGAVVGTWEKGDVLRTLRLSDGQDAWSIPRTRGVAALGPDLVTVGAQALWLVSAEEGRTLKRHPLPADPLLGPVPLGELVAITLPGGRLLVLDPRSGATRWEKTLPPAAEPGAMLAAGTTLLVALREPGSADAGARLLAFRDGAALWEAKVPPGERPTTATALGGIHVAGDLILWPDPRRRCLRALALGDGRERFRTCGLRVDSPAARFADVLYVLGEDPRSEAALVRGDPWYSVDFPVLKVDAIGGGIAPVLLQRRRRGEKTTEGSSRPQRALRLPWVQPSGGVLYLVGRNRFLTALRVGHPTASKPPVASPGRP